MLKRGVYKRDPGPMRTAKNATGLSELLIRRLGADVTIDDDPDLLGRCCALQAF